MFTLQAGKSAYNPKTEQAEQSWAKTEKYVDVWYMKWFDVKIIFVRPTNPKIQAIALFPSAKLRPKTESDQNKIVTIAFALSCQPFWHPYMYTFVKVNFWPNQWFQMIRDGRKSAIAYIFGLVGWTEIILTSNHFIYQTPIYFSVFAQLCSACSVLGL